MRHLTTLTVFLTCLCVLSVVTLWKEPSATAATLFNHLTHNDYLTGQKCVTCHLNGAAEITPSMETCLSCHDRAFVDGVELPSLATHGPLWGLNHRTFAKGAAANCNECHQQADCLECHKAGFADEMGSFGNDLANVHRSDFLVTHPIASRTEPQRCYSCHETRFCSECHERFAPEDLAVASHRRGFSDGTLGGAHTQFNDHQCADCHRNSVLPSHQWSAQHAREARKNLATCQSCHADGESCLKCHSAVSGLRANPHPAEWNEISGRLEKASGGRTCRRCH